MKFPRFLPWILAVLTVTGLGVALIVFAARRAHLTIHVRTAENGGVSPDYISARVGQPLRLRLLADDVEQTFAVGPGILEPLTLGAVFLVFRLADMLLAAKSAKEAATSSSASP